MKSILILSHAMELGGAEKSLLGLLNAIDSKKYQVDLFLMRHEGSLLEDIPENINLLPEIPAYTVLARPLKDVIKERHFILAFGRIVGKIKARSYEKKRNIIDSGVGLEYSHKYTVPYMPKIQKQKVYDMAISFLTPHYFVEQKVRAKKKIAWIHTDYSKVQINVESELKMWKKYDKIVSISDAVTESFLKVFPDLKDKIVVIENILPEQLIYKQMDEFDVSEEMFSEGVKLLSIGRYCYAKNFDNIPNICSRMLNKGINITWYIIGFGVAEELIKEKIREEKKYTQQQLADKLYVSRQTVCRWENGSRCPDLITAKKLAMELGVTLDELISDEDITDIQSKYGIWKFDRVKEREKIQMMQKRILDFIEIIGGIFLAISLLLRVQFDMKVPAWITIICILIVTVTFLFNFVLAKKLDRK